MKTPNTVTEDQLAAAFALVEKAKLPPGFAVQRVKVKAGRLGVLITGPKTDGHQSGEVLWEPDMARQPVTDETVAGLVRSCKAWRKEGVLADDSAS